MRYSRLKVSLTLVTSGVVAASALFAQGPPPTAQKEAMARLAYWAGTWKGKGTVVLGPGQERETEVTETISSKVDGLVLQIDGLGKTRGADGKETVTHNAFGVVWYDAEQKQYRMRTFVMQGYSIETELKPVGEGFEWTFKAGGAVTIRYNIHNRDGHWKEVGEMSTDGNTWRKIFEMNLDKQKP